MLLAVDINDRAEDAVRLAIPWARRLGARLDLGFTSEWSTAGLPTPPQPSDQLDALWDEWNRRADGERLILEQLHAHLPADVAGAAHFWSGRAVEVLPDVSAPYDLLVTATHSRHGLQRVLLGSVTARVLRASRVPVLVLGLGDPQPEPGGALRVLAPLDEHEPGALPWIRTHLPESRVELVHVLPAAGWSPLAWVAEPSLPPDAPRARRAIESLMGDRGAAHGFPNAPVHVLTRDGNNPGDSIAQLAAALPADLVVMPTHGRKGLEAMFIGSVAERVAEMAPCGVLVVPLARIGS